MKVSLNLIRKFTTVDIPVDELVSKINQQLGGVESVIDIGARYRGATIVRIVSCEDHPDADRLHVCKIDDGGQTADVERDQNGYVQVVCGAPNARQGITVVWLPPGSTVPSSFADAEPFVLSVRPLRGVNSNGMLASPRELGIGDNHDGILEITGADLEPGSTIELTPGAAFADVFGLNDTIIDIENKMFTHRPDCFGQLGVAREIAGIQQQQFTSPDWYMRRVPQDIYATFKNTEDYNPETALPLSVRNDAPELVPRLVAVTVQGVTVRPSPLWLQVTLVRLGSRPINNIVDITNYVMLLTGQPLHAYDYDKIGSSQLTARVAQTGESVDLLNGKTIKLTAGDIVITDGTKPIGLAGVMGGSGTEVSAETTNIVLECANFDMYTIRKTSMRHGLFTDAVTRFNKGQSSNQNDIIANYATALIYDVAGGSFQAVYDGNYNRNGLGSRVDVYRQFINQRLGLDLPLETISRLLENVEFNMEPFGDGWVVGAPFWRTDVEQAEDVVEEVGRLYGFDKLPRQLPQHSLKPADRNPYLDLKSVLRTELSARGASEILTYSFVHENVLQRAGQDADQAFKLGNALSPELQYYRLSLLPSLLDKIHANARAGYDAFALFELGKAHNTTEVDAEGLPKEVKALSFAYAAKQSQPGAAYYVAKRYLDQLLTRMQAADLVRYEPLLSADLYDNQWIIQMAAPFETGRSAVLRDSAGLIWGVVGEFKTSVRKGFKLPAYTAGFELDPTLFLQPTTTSAYRALPKYPKIWQDICLRVATDISYQTVYNLVETSLNSQTVATMLSSLEPIDIYQPESVEYKQITLRFSVAAYDKTMTDAEVSKMLNQVAAKAAQDLRAERI